MSRTILIGAGGTGGHIYPAIAIAKALRAVAPDVRMEFVGTAQGLESTLVPREGFKLHVLPIGRLHSSVPWRERLWTLVRLPVAMLKALWLIIKLRPALVLGVGGYASGPIVAAAVMLFRRTAIWEPNAFPGLANRLLAPWVDECLVVFADAARHMKSRKLRQVGMPVRASIVEINQPSAVAQPGQPERKELRILVFGGSQGSRAINRVITAFIAESGDWFKDIEWVHQTGPGDFAEIQEKYQRLQAAVDVQAFLYDMEYRYRWADLVIARSGTGTVSELAACGKAAILVPFPDAADNHQQKNAEALAKTGAAIMILQREFTSGRLREVLSELRAHRDVLARLGENIYRFHRPNADVEIAKILLEVMR